MNKNRKKGCLIAALSFVAVIVIAVIVIYNVISSKLDSFKDVDFASLDMTKVEDGTYTGSADGSIVKATVEVTVKDHTITGIKIVKHDNGKGKPAEVIVNDIIAKNSLEVDAISGATHSSNVIKTAVLNALTK
jgi:uncharacterized protein with FMN-binding domain